MKNESFALDRKPGEIADCYATSAVSSIHLPQKVPQKMIANDKQYLQSATRLIMARGQTSTAFRTTALNNQSARFGAHANAEAMRLCTAAIIWLKCTFHILSP